MSLAAAMADATSRPMLPQLATSAAAVGGQIVGGSGRYRAAAVARLDCAAAIVGRIQARPPKEEVCLAFLCGA
jgi:hypothetical protein